MDAPVFLIPHSQKEFRTADDLRRWLSDDLRTKASGKYQVARGKGWEPIPSGSICVFHKQRVIVGDAVVSRGLQYDQASEISPDTELPYEGSVTFDPATIRTFDPPIPFGEAQSAAGCGFTWRSIQPLSREQYERILALQPHDAA